MNMHNEQWRPRGEESPVDPWEQTRRELVSGGFFNAQGEIPPAQRKALFARGWTEDQVRTMEELQRNATRDAMIVRREPRTAGVQSAVEAQSRAGHLAAARRAADAALARDQAQRTAQGAAAMARARAANLVDFFNRT